MANLEQTLSIIFSADNRLGSTINDITRQIAGFGDSGSNMYGLENSLDRIGQSFTDIGTAGAKAAETTKGLGGAASSLPAVTNMKIDMVGWDAAMKEALDFQNGVKAIPETKAIRLGIDADEAAIEAEWKILTGAIDPEVLVKLGLTGDKGSYAAALAALDSALPEIRDVSVKTTADASSIDTARNALMEAIDPGILVKLGLTGDKGSYAAALAALDSALPEIRDVKLMTTADAESIITAKDMIIKTFPDGTIYMTNIGTKVDAANLAATKKKIEEVIPKDQLVEIQAKIDIAKIKEQSDIIQTTIQWKAKIDIADVQANAEIIKAAFKSIDNTITSTGTTISSIIGNWAELQGSGKGGTSFIEQQIVNENTRRNDALAMQKELVTAEVANMNARTDSLKAGNAMITINGAGLQPHLEAFMFEILAAIQIRANAEGQKFLVGL
jgi:hypothetical protein